MMLSCSWGESHVKGSSCTLRGCTPLLRLKEAAVGTVFDSERRLCFASWASRRLHRSYGFAEVAVR